MDNLNCFRVGCPGTLEYISDGETLYRCDECGDELSQPGVEELATDSGALAQLADVLLDGGGI